MPDVSFQEEEEWQQRFVPPPKNSRLIELVMKTGITKDPKQANYILIGLAVVVFLVSFFVFARAISGPGAPKGAITPGAVLSPESPENIGAFPSEDNEVFLDEEEFSF